MKILVTGAKGFVGKNLIAELRNQGCTDILEYDLDTDQVLLDTYTQECDFVFHLAGVNRPPNERDFDKGNREFTREITDHLRKHNNQCPIVLSSSTQAELDNPYGKSKKAAEDEVFDYAAATGASVMVYRLPNVFGKWCRPNYNSAVATFCYNIARDLPIQINDSNTNMKLVYIDDVVNEFLNALSGKANQKGRYGIVEPMHILELGEIADLIRSFKESRVSKSIPNMADPFIKKLYSTYLSYLPADQFSYPLIMNLDDRGSFTEFTKSPDRGQVSINISKPGVTKGNHWHHTKNEKFCVVSGQGIIKLRAINGDEVIEYPVSGDKLEVVDIPPGYTHNIVNTGDANMVTVMWANEQYDPKKPDTYYLEV